MGKRREDKVLEARRKWGRREDCFFDTPLATAASGQPTLCISLSEAPEAPVSPGSEKPVPPFSV